MRKDPWLRISDDPPHGVEGQWIILHSAHNPYTKVCVSWALDGWFDIGDRQYYPSEDFTHWRPLDAPGA